MGNVGNEKMCRYNKKRKTANKLKCILTSYEMLKSCSRLNSTNILIVAWHVSSSDKSKSVWLKFSISRNTHQVPFSIMLSKLTLLSVFFNFQFIFHENAYNYKFTDRHFISEKFKTSSSRRMFCHLPFFTSHDENI